MSNATGTSQSSSSTRGNVSVTNINCTTENGIPLNEQEQLSSASIANATVSNVYDNNNVRISVPVPKMEESDGSDSELSNIEKIARVNMRKVKENDKNNSRPMSWEGELSENDEMMDVEKSSPLIQLPSNNEDIKPKLQLIDDKTLIKPEVCTPVLDLMANRNIKQQQQQQPQQHIQQQQQFLNVKKNNSEIMNLKYEPSTSNYQQESLMNSPMRAKQSSLLPTNPSPDSAIHSIYTQSSPSQSPLANRHAPYTPSLSRNNSDASHSSYSYSSEFNSPTHSPIQGRHPIYPSSSSSSQQQQQQSFNGSLHHSLLYRPMLDGDQSYRYSQHSNEENNNEQPETIPTAGISRQQLINSPCPICGDKISGFHYGIFSCESCKGFFKRTVQNRKNYVCLRGACCPVTIATRKKCPACRFEKCLNKGMKLEAIREDRTRGGRSTYQCSYTLPVTVSSLTNVNQLQNDSSQNQYKINGNGIKLEQNGSNNGTCSNSSLASTASIPVPPLLQEIMDVEYLWKFNDSELNRLNQSSADPASLQNNPILASAGFTCDNPDMIANLCKIADHRLYKIVKWCKSLPLFKNISIDDQICLLINSWCELLLFSCCYRSIPTPGEIKISAGNSISIAHAKLTGLHACIERMLNLTDHLRRLKVDNYEYVAMKVIVLLSSDTADLKEPEKVRESQEKALQALQAYTLGHYPDTPAKFGELLLRIPELQRTCQVSKDMLTIKPKDGESSFNLLMELLRGEH